MRNPRETGISGITGTMVTIKHANESERIDVADTLKKQRGETLDLSGDDIVIAAQGDRLLGFAVLKKDSGGRVGFVSLSEGKLHQGIGREMLRHLFEYSSAQYICADRTVDRHFPHGT